MTDVALFAPAQYVSQTVGRHVQWAVHVLAIGGRRRETLVEPRHEAGQEITLRPKLEGVDALEKRQREIMSAIAELRKAKKMLLGLSESLDAAPRTIAAEDLNASNDE